MRVENRFEGRATCTTVRKEHGAYPCDMQIGEGVVAEPAISHSSLGWCLLQADTVQLGVAISSRLFKATAGGVQGSSGQSP